MSNEKKHESDVDLEKQENGLPTEAELEPLEKVKERPPPGINASLVLFYAVFLFMFAVGWINLNNCSITRLIPIYLIVAGFIGALIRFISNNKNKYLFMTTVVLVIFYSIWHVLGSYWVYREFQPNYIAAPEVKYCDRTTYLLAFWMLTLQSTVVGFAILLSGCYMMMRGDFKKK